MEPNYKPAARASQTLGEDCYDGSGGSGAQRTSDRHQSGPAAGRTRANVWVKIQLEPVAKPLPTPTKEPRATNVFFSEGENGNPQFGRRPNVEMAGWHGGGTERELRAGEEAAAAAAAGARLLMHV